MQTRFTPQQLADPNLKVAEEALRKCVHCGFCTATCPTYVLLGNEPDSPRGRIHLIKDMLEKDKPASDKVALHLDRCLSCMACMTACPSGVDYMHLIDQARVRVEKTHRRPLMTRLLQFMLAFLLPRPWAFRLALRGARLIRPVRGLLPGRLKTLAALAPSTLPAASETEHSGVHRARGTRRKRVVLLTGCAQKVLDPGINDATVRLLTRHGCEVVIPQGQCCCGALVHHMGREEEALAFIKANITAWRREWEGEGLDAIIINTSGCGTVVKDYGFLLREDPRWAVDAAKVSALTRDVTEWMAELGLEKRTETGLVVAYHSACSLQHAQRIREQPKALLEAAGFQVRDVPEGHLCCGAAGTYNLLQPELATQLRERKVAHIESLKPDVIAAGNIACLQQIGVGTSIPCVHIVELLDWASGGPEPARLRKAEAGQAIPAKSPS